MNARRLLVSAALVFLALIQVGGWAQEKYVPKDNEELYGTWTNEQNPKFESTRPQKAVITAGRYEFYHGISDTAPYQTGTVEIQAKWTDSEGNIWYKTFDTVTGGIWKGIRSQGLYKLSKSGTVLEKQFNRIGGGDFGPNNYPPKIDPKSDYPYTILYRSAN